MATIKQTLVDLFELDKMEPAKAEEMVNRLSNLVFQATLMRVLPTLSDKDMDEYEKIIKDPSSGETLFKFLNEKVPNFSDIINEEAEKLRNDLAEDIQAAESM